MQLSVEYSKREVGCKVCPVKICKGSLRICVGSANSRKNYHTQCFFNSIAQNPGNVANIPDASAFQGLSTLDPIDAQRIQAQVTVHNIRQKQSNQQQGTTVKTKQPATKTGQGSSSTSAGGPCAGMGNSLVNPSLAAPIYISSSESDPDENTPSTSKKGITPKQSNSSPSSSSIQRQNTVSVIVVPQQTPPAPGTSSGIKTTCQTGIKLTGISPLGKASINLTGIAPAGQSRSGKDDTAAVDDSEDNELPAQKRHKPVPEDNDDENEDEVCSICLDPPVHPVKLPCDHMYCYLCAKGLVMTDMMFAPPSCSLCRQPFSPAHLESSQVLQEASSTLDLTPPIGFDPATDDDDRWQWFYQGNKGWWRFERRNNEDLEKAYLKGEQNAQLLICGKVYTIDFVRMEQYQNNYPQRKRHIKRDLRSSQCKGVAGLVKSSRK